jgi:hypothetical protein
MASNYLEQLVAEWYEYQGYFIRRNVLVGKRKEGGHECELDIVAFHPISKELIHVEPTMDGDSWDNREKRYRKKFNAGKKHIPEIFHGLQISKEIKQIALLGYGSNAKHKELGGGTTVTVAEFICNIIQTIGKKSIYRNAISELYPILRTLQFMTENKKTIIDILNEL